MQRIIVVLVLFSCACRRVEANHRALTEVTGEVCSGGYSFEGSCNAFSDVVLLLQVRAVCFTLKSHLQCSQQHLNQALTPLRVFNNASIFHSGVICAFFDAGEQRRGVDSHGDYRLRTRLSKPIFPRHAVLRRPPKLCRAQPRRRLLPYQWQCCPRLLQWRAHPCAAGRPHPIQHERD